VELDELWGTVDCALAKPAARIAAHPRKLTRRVSNIEREDDMS
jgi:hypothetical protein